MNPSLYRLAADRRYTEIPAAATATDLQWSDSYGSTALHLLCQSRKITPSLLHAVKACLDTLPDAVQWANASTWTPLHCAVNHFPHDAWCCSRVELILLLLSACPAALSERATTRYKSKTAFHMAVEVDAPYAVLEAMLLIDPSLATATYMSPKRTRTTYFCSRSAPPPPVVQPQLEMPLHVLWWAGKSTFKMALLLEAACTGKLSSACNSNNSNSSCRRRIWNHHSGTAAASASSSSPPHKFLLLHAACSMGDCPRPYLEQIVVEHPKHWLLTDARGLLPLHIVLRRPFSPYQQFCLQLLLDVAPQAAAIRDCCLDRLPLHMALAAKDLDCSDGDDDDDVFTTALVDSCSSNAPLTWHKGGVRELTFAHPTALRVADPVTGLVPFLAAAIAAAYSKEHLSTAFELLLAAPEMLAAVRHVD